jgi:hypothetical protein
LIKPPIPAVNGHPPCLKQTIPPIRLPGADYFAHIRYTRSPSGDPGAPGYVIEKAEELSDTYSEFIDIDFAHYVIEATIDLLLKGDDPALPGKLFFANLFRSWQDRSLLMRVYVWRWWQRRTDWLTLATAELTFRQLVNRCAMALMLPAPIEAQALAELGAELASELFGLEGITAERLITLWCPPQELFGIEPDQRQISFG